MIQSSKNHWDWTGASQLSD